jgi:hypothetical protein
MSIHYQIDPFTTVGNILDVLTAESGTSDATGSTIIRIPDGVSIKPPPTKLVDLLIDKSDGLLAFYAGFTQIFSDSCLNTTVDLTNSHRLLVSNGFVNHCLLDGGIYLSTVHVGALIPAPSQCVLTFEEYVYVDSDDKTGRFQRTYTESSGLTCQVSFNGGGSFNSTTNGAVLNVPVPDQGSDLKVRFDNPTGDRVYLGSWSLVY